LRLGLEGLFYKIIIFQVAVFIFGQNESISCLLSFLFVLMKDFGEDEKKDFIRVLGLD